MRGIAVVKRRLRPHNLFMTSRIKKVPAVSASNPLLQDFDLPSYSLIKPEHVEPAIEQILADNRAADRYAPERY